MAGPKKEFWQMHFASGKLPWDRGGPSLQLVNWIENGALKPGERILVPGCGQGWEVVTLAVSGMLVTGVDYVADALLLCRRLLERSGVQADLVEADVLTWMPVYPMDVVFEQTCLSALHPDHWTQYATKIHGWLRPGGKLLASFIQLPMPEVSQGFITGPPYHCDINAMRALFPATQWDWPKPPYFGLPQPAGQFELSVELMRK